MQTPRRPALGLGLIAVAGLHALLLGSPAAVPAGADAGTAAAGREPVHLMGGTPWHRLPDAATPRLGEARPAAQQAPAQIAVPSPSQRQPVPASTTATAAATGSSPQPGETLAAADSWDQHYLPRQALSRAPAAQETVQLPYPDLAPLGHWRARLTLFISASGQVQRVRVDQAEQLDASEASLAASSATPAGLPAALEDSARQAFLQARFSPGELNGQPWASRLRVEVEFAAEPGGEVQADAGANACTLTPLPAPAGAPPRCAPAS
jgi:protein TonB